MSLLLRLLRAQQRTNLLCVTDINVMRKVKDGIELNGDDETDALWWLIGNDYVAYEVNAAPPYLTDKGEKTLEEYDVN